LIFGSLALIAFFGWYFAGPLTAAIILGGQFLACILIFVGLQFVHYAHVGRKGYSSTLGHVALVLGLLLFVCDPLGLAAGHWLVRIAEESKRAVDQARANTLKQQQVTRDHDRWQKAIDELHVKDPFRIANGLASLRALPPDSEFRPEVLHLLDFHLSNPDPSLRYQVLLTLCWIGTEEFIVKIEPFLKSSDASVRQAAKDSIDHILRREAPDKRNTIELEKTIADLKSDNIDRIRSGAAKVLTATFRPEKQTEVVQLLEGHLSNPNRMVRSFVFKALGKWGNPATIAKLEPFLNDKDADIKQSAELAIRAIRRREKQGN
jgi:hypothetical protein